MSQAHVFTLHLERRLVYVIKGLSQLLSVTGLAYEEEMFFIMSMSTWQKHF